MDIIHGYFILPVDLDRRGNTIGLYPNPRSQAEKEWILTEKQPNFRIGALPVFGDLILAPMDGYSDLPYRSITRGLGSALSYTEFINAVDILTGHHHLEKRLAFTEAERPIVIQIFDDDPDRLLKAALVAREKNPDVIDINMGCSARNVSGRGAGAGLLRETQKIARIFFSLSRALDIPVTAKIRLGWDSSSLNYLEVARVIEDNGGKLIAVHGRTKKQGFTGTADWDAIAAVKQQVSIPVAANGDVRTPEDIARIKSHTGCDAVMIGRSAIGNPWIFSRIAREDVSPQEVFSMMEHHIQMMVNFYGADLALLLFRKHASRYIEPYHWNSDTRRIILNSSTQEDFIVKLKSRILHQ